ncbi:MAG: NAD(P)H-dependent oxidoreductase [Candidatus Heimdallarchaeaceae archaeon]
MTKALMLMGSPRGKKSTSNSVGTYLLEQLEKKGLEISSTIIRSQLNTKDKINEMVEEVKEADIIIHTAPLYDDFLPYIVIKTFEIIADRNLDLKKKQFIPIVNCGLPEPEHISEAAIPIYK